MQSPTPVQDEVLKDTLNIHPVHLSNLEVNLNAAADFFKSAALCYFVGRKVVIPVLRFIGRRLPGGGKKKTSVPDSSQSASSSNASALDASMSEDCWRVVAASAPAVPADYRQVADEELPCSPQEFYARVISSASPIFCEQGPVLAKHRNCAVGGWEALSGGGSSGSSSSQWTRGPPGDDSILRSSSVFEYVLGKGCAGHGFARTFTFVNPKKAPSPCDTRVVQRQQYAVYKDGTLVFSTVSSFLDIPFNQSFTVNTLWTVTPVAPVSRSEKASCRVVISVKVNFIKRILVAAVIRASSFRENASFYNSLLQAAKHKITSLPALTCKQLAALAKPRCPGSASNTTARSELAGSGNGATKQPQLNTAEARSGDAFVGSGQGADVVTGRPIWKQLRALLVFAVLVLLVLHQMFLGREVFRLRQHVVQ